MLSAIGRLIRIAFFVIFALSLALITLHQLGSKQRYAEIDHPILKIPFIWVGAFEKEPEPPAQVFDLWRLRLNQAGEWQVVINGEMQPLPKAKNQAGIWLEVIDPTSTDRLEKLSEYIKKEGLSEKVIFGTPYQSISREMRKIEPMWLYGSSVAEGAKVRFMTSLYLETMASIDADILLITKINSPRLVEELHKRHKKIFLSLRSQTSEVMAAAQELKNTQMIDGAVIAP